MAASVDVEFSTTNVFKCSKCPYTVDNVEEIKSHIATCNNEEGDEEGVIYTSQDNSISRMTFDMYPDEETTPTFQWSHDATVQLLQFLKIELKSAKDLKTATTFNRISKRLAANEYHVSQAQCDVKWRNLKKNYVRVKAKSEQRGFHYKKSWRYYEAVEELVKLWDSKKGTRAGPSVLLDPTGSEINSESDNNDDDSDPNELPELKKMKLSHQQPKWFRQFRKQCERRHKERQAIATRLANTLDKFVERVNCKCYKKWK